MLIIMEQLGKYLGKFNGVFFLTDNPLFNPQQKLIWGFTIKGLYTKSTSLLSTTKVF